MVQVGAARNKRWTLSVAARIGSQHGKVFGGQRCSGLAMPYCTDRSAGRGESRAIADAFDLKVEGKTKGNQPVSVRECTRVLMFTSMGER